jgi:hypothetical protein
VLDLPIGAQVGDCGLVHLDVVVITEIQDIFPVELSVVVNDDGIRYLIVDNDVLDEIHYLLGANLHQGLASIHLVYLPIAQSRWVKSPGAFLKGPRRSRPHMTNDHVMGIVWSS